MEGCEEYETKGKEIVFPYFSKETLPFMRSRRLAWKWTSSDAATRGVSADGMVTNKTLLGSKDLALRRSR